MRDQLVEEYRPRPVSNLGTWEINPLQIKVYGLLYEGKNITQDMLATARSFLKDDVLAHVAAEGEDNGLGFIIIHPGSRGITISAHWWIQGSVLCQRNYRKLYDVQEPMDTVKRPVIACVWELAIINDEQVAWRETMMTPEPNHAAYLKYRTGLLVT